ncbi:hypothetical protein NE236_14120 [Actinoallomurus purpureus]|uniref:CHAP domain-containing protein n=1 Tax=Actinoallomurus purpureus TaxID=478114 RepID=UPI0020930767|nr:CHAP domain-containing protein [Actinoallomurus purpureus]MCO6006126.1 hypothetical protein [Actinoallomurus purpureus]
MAKTQIGPRRRADGSTKYGDWFAELIGDPAYRSGDFCAMGLLWCAWRTDQVLALGGVHREWAWVPSWWRHWQDAGRSTQRPARGRIAFFDFNSTGDPEHVGAVLQDNGNGSIITIEFNTLNGWCAIRGRRLADVLGFGDPEWQGRRVTVVAGGDSCWRG